MTWEPSNGSRVDFYHYQLIDYLTDIPLLDSNTTNTTIVLSGIPYSVNVLLFIIFAYTKLNVSHKINCDDNNIIIAVRAWLQ